MERRPIKINLKPKGQHYSRDEWLVLLNYFYSQVEPTHTDNHAQLVAFAGSIGRTPGSVDANLRTIKKALTQAAGFDHGASTMRNVVQQYWIKRPQLAQDAAQAMARIQANP